MPRAPELASIDGRAGPTGDAVIPAHDDGLLRGDGVFEVVKVYGGRPHAMDDHLDRMERSAAAISLALPREQIEAEALTLLDQAGEVDAQLRLVVTRGGRRLVFIEPLVEWPETAVLATVNYAPSVILTGVKSLSYGANMHSTRIAKERGANESLLVTPDGTVLEGPTCSIFWVDQSGVLKTPSLESGILDSIVRDRVIAGMEVEQGAYPLEDLLSGSEAFLASTTREIQPVSAIDETELPEAPGPVTLQAQNAFRAMLERELGSQPD